MTKLEWVLKSKIIAIVRGLAPEHMLKLAGALYDGGIDLMEVTFAQASPQTWRATAEAIHAVSDSFRGKMLIGAGTVLTEEQLMLAKNAGASARSEFCGTALK